MCALLLGGCSRFAPDAGYEILLVKKPWFFGHGGIDAESIKNGVTFGALTTQSVRVHMQPQKFEADLADTMTSDGVAIKFHAIVVLRVTNSVDLISKFGVDWFKNNLEAPSRP